jgi:hypothetical protein
LEQRASGGFPSQARSQKIMVNISSLQTANSLPQFADHDSHSAIHENTHTELRHPGERQSLSNFSSGSFRRRLTAEENMKHIAP